MSLDRFLPWRRPLLEDADIEKAPAHVHVHGPDAGDHANLKSRSPPEQPRRHTSSVSIKSCDVPLQGVTYLNPDDPEFADDTQYRTLSQLEAYNQGRCTLVATALLIILLIIASYEWLFVEKK